MLTILSCLQQFKDESTQFFILKEFIHWLVNYSMRQHYLGLTSLVHETRIFFMSFSDESTFTITDSTEIAPSLSWTLQSSK